MFKSSLAFFSSFLLLSPSVFAFNTFSNSENESLNISEQVAQGNTAEISDYVYELSKQITVEITTNDNRGSGTLLSKNNNTYLVLTNGHVINNNKTVTLKTYDGKTYQGTLVNNSLIGSISDDYDLVVIEFTSEQEYTVPTEDISTASQDFPVIAAGYVAETGEYLVTEGKVTHNLTKSFKEGYNFGYTNNIKQGMSGGPILNSMGELIGINGRSAHPILNIGYVYEDGASPTDEEIQEYRQVSWGIPINTLLTYIKDEMAIAYNLPLPQDVASVGIPTYTGYIAELEEKAQQFVVKIDSSSKGNGSGVIIAKQGNVYTVLTADHVLCEKTKDAIASAPCIEQFSYTITTHDGKTRNLDESTIIRQEGVDLAVFKFESNDNYAVAELADYNPNKDNFVFAAGFPKIGNDDPQWLFSGGRVEEKEQGILQIRQNDLSNEQSGALQGVASLTGGYELVYTSITYGGMSGGAVLDAQGRVIGIHGRAEGANDNSITHLGYSLGIPISTFVALQDRFKAKPQSLTIALPQISEQQREDITKAIVETEIPNTRAEAKVWIERGGQLWRLKRLDEAVEAFDKAIKQNNPDNVYFAWYGKGQALFNKKEFEAAIGALEQAINALPDMARVSDNKQEKLEELQSSILLRQGAAYRYLEEYEKALEAINESITLSPNNPNLYNEKWGVLDKLERYQEALEAINKAIELAPRAVFYNNRGIIYKNRQKYDLALSDYNQALTFNPQDAVAYNNRGILYQEQKQYDLALSDYNQALKFNPQDAVAYYNRGLLYQEQKQY
ncbi:tetratricopeptide repeat-containing S1 family peptidase, partial [Crocosphaera watsonii]